MRPDHRPAFHPSLHEQSTIAAERPEDWPDHERGYVALDGRAVSQCEPQSKTKERRDFVNSQEADQTKLRRQGRAPLIEKRHLLDRFPRYRTEFPDRPSDRQDRERLRILGQPQRLFHVLLIQKMTRRQHRP